MKTALFFLMALVMSTCSMNRNIDINQFPKVGESFDTAITKLRSIGRIFDVSSERNPNERVYATSDVQTEGIKFKGLLVFVDSLNFITDVWLGFEPESCDEGMKFIEALPNRAKLETRGHTYYTTVQKQGCKLEWTLDCDAPRINLSIR